MIESLGIAIGLYPSGQICGGCGETLADEVLKYLDRLYAISAVYAYSPNLGGDCNKENQSVSAQNELKGMLLETYKRSRKGRVELEKSNSMMPAFDEVTKNGQQVYCVKTQPIQN